VNYQSFDGDTSVMWATEEAAYRACGAMVASIDKIFLPPSDPDYIETAYCCTRPPGHHAERGKAQGFCFFNNAAIGAKYAQSRYGESHGIRKVAVLDFDVHHGNGTEEGFQDDETLFYGSTHEKDNYPGTGHDPSPLVCDKARSERDRRIVNRYLTGGDGYYKNPNKSSRLQFRQKWPEIVAEMKRFKPDLVIFSSGFDAHSSDPLGNCWLEDEDFHWATEIVMQALDELDDEDKDKDEKEAAGVEQEPTKGRKQKRRAVAILEGGYDLEAISTSAVQHVRALLRLPCTSITPEDATPLDAVVSKEEEEEEVEEVEAHGETFDAMNKELAERLESLEGGLGESEDLLVESMKTLGIVPEDEQQDDDDDDDDDDDGEKENDGKTS